MSLSFMSGGQGRRPRCILLNGETPITWTSWTIEHSGIYEAGTIHITVPAIYEQWPYWMQQTEIIVDVYVGFPDDPENYTKADLTLLMSARIDNLALDPAKATLTLTGRDLTSLFIDKKISGEFKNQTASEIVQSFAAQMSELSTQITATKIKIGNYYDSDKVQLHKQVSMWTLMTYLAQQEGLQCFVLGRTLYFGNFKSGAANNPRNLAAYPILFEPPTLDRPYPMANVESLTFSHDMTIAGDVTVTVHSYHGAQNKPYVGIKSSPQRNKTVEKSAKPTQSKQSYDFTFPGLTEAQCQEKAANLLNEIGQHELKMDAKAPGDLFLFPWTPVTVDGTGTIFDTTYQVAKISRSFDSRGYTMTMSCQTAPQQTVTLQEKPGQTAKST